MKVVRTSPSVHKSGWPYHAVIERFDGRERTYYVDDRVNELLAANTALVERARAAESRKFFEFTPETRDEIARMLDIYAQTVIEVATSDGGSADPREADIFIDALECTLKEDS